MKCTSAVDYIYEMEDSALPVRIARQIVLAAHLVFCRRCAGELARYEEARALLRGGFPPASDFGAAVMNRIYRELEESAEAEDADGAFGHYGEPGGFSTRGWVIAGLVMLVSLSALFFSQDFTNGVLFQSSSFLLPLGIIIGTVVSAYGALFIGSHLKEFSARFKL